MKVKALKPHNNGYGAKFEKAKGDEYEMPDDHAAPLIAAGLVEDVNARPPRPPRRRATKPAAARPAAEVAGENDRAG